MEVYNKRLLAVSIGLMILCAMTWFQATSNFFVERIRNRVENVFYDEMLKVSESRYTHSGARILIVDIDEESISKIGRWPWPRSQMIDLLNRIQNDGAAVVAFDIVFGEPDVSAIDLLEHSGADVKELEKLRHLISSDKDFAEAIRNANTDTVLGFVAHNQSEETSRGTLAPSDLKLTGGGTEIPNFSRYLANIETLQAATKSAGFMTGLPDDDGVIRRAPLLARVGDHVYPSLALEASRAYLQSDGIKVAFGDNDELHSIGLDKAQIWTDAKGQVLIPFRKISGPYSYVSASKILSGEVPKDFFQGALVFIGSSSFRFGDLHATPAYPKFPGVAIQATVADAIISHQVFYSPSWSRKAEIILTVAIGLLLAFTLPFLGFRGTTILASSVLLLVIGAYCLCFFYLGMVFAVTGTVGQVLVNTTFNLGYRLIIESRRRHSLKALFGQYVPPEYVKLMTEHPDEYTAEGTSANLTVLFSDIMGFTSLVERLSAKEVRSLLREFFTPMTKVIFENKGTIDKYVGDMLMAFWGAPISDPLHQEHALEAALQMREQVAILRDKFSSQGLPPVEIGIGINTGDMFVGDMGSEYRKAYTVLGDPVNVASRLEALVRYYGVHIVVGPQTRIGQDKFAFRLLDRVRVKGRKESLQIFELVCRLSDLSAEKAEEIKAHEAALKLYFARDWKGATEEFTKLHALHHEAKLYSLFLARIRTLSEASLPDDWDGGYEWTTK